MLVLVGKAAEPVHLPLTRLGAGPSTTHPKQQGRTTIAPTTPAPPPPPTMPAAPTTPRLHPHRHPHPHRYPASDISHLTRHQSLRPQQNMHKHAHTRTRRTLQVQRLLHRAVVGLSRNRTVVVRHLLVYIHEVISEYSFLDNNRKGKSSSSGNNNSGGDHGSRRRRDTGPAVWLAHDGGLDEYTLGKDGTSKNAKVREHKRRGLLAHDEDKTFLVVRRPRPRPRPRPRTRPRPRPRPRRRRRRSRRRRRRPRRRPRGHRPCRRLRRHRSRRHRRRRRRHLTTAELPFVALL
jgi:hypothetical protein